MQGLAPSTQPQIPPEAHERNVHTNIVLCICYLFAVIALITGTLALTLGLSMVPDSQVIEASSDNEFRFFSAFWLAYGAFCFWVARDLTNRGAFVPALAAVMFLAGVGRTLSFLLVGEPIPLYLVGSFIELFVPFLWVYSYRRMLRQGRQENE